MNFNSSYRFAAISVVSFVTVLCGSLGPLSGVLSKSVLAKEEAGKTPAVGEKAADFELPAVAAKEKEQQSSKEKEQHVVKLSEELKASPVVLVVLRGFPGYQCPLCSRQVVDLTSKAKEFAKLQAKVLLVYPGSAEGLAERAAEFLENAELPEPFEMLIDPDYEFVNRYGLRWDEQNETAFPSTFVIDQEGLVRFAKISQSHGDRAETKAILAELKKAAK